MTDISATLTTIRRLSLPRLRFARPELAKPLSAVASSVGDALSMAYVAPYSSTRQRPKCLPDADLEGRDPRW